MPSAEPAEPAEPGEPGAHPGEGPGRPTLEQPAHEQLQPGGGTGQRLGQPAQGGFARAGEPPAGPHTGPQPANPNRPPLEPPQMGQLNRPLGQPAEEQGAATGRPNRPPLEAPQMGQLNRPMAHGGNAGPAFPQTGAGQQPGNGGPSYPATSGPAEEGLADVASGLAGLVGSRPGTEKPPPPGAPTGLAGAGAAPGVPGNDDPESAPSGLPGRTTAVPPPLKAADEAPNDDEGPSGLPRRPGPE